MCGGTCDGAVDGTSCFFSRARWFRNAEERFAARRVHSLPQLAAAKRAAPVFPRAKRSQPRRQTETGSEKERKSDAPEGEGGREGGSGKGDTRENPPPSPTECVRM